MNKVKSREALPILLMAFNRTKTLERQLLNLDSLSPRKIVIHVDGATRSTQESQKSVLKLAECWAEKSEHNIEIKAKDTNLGLLKHFPIAASDFFSSHTFGIILEDDIDFGPSFIDMCEQAFNSKSLNDLWSICGHNPSGKFLKGNRVQVSLRLSHIHTIWGWATSSFNIERYLSYGSKTKDQIFKDIDAFSKEITRDIFLQRSIKLTWRRKIARYLHPNSGGSWDNLWELAGWKSKLPSLMPSHSLSTEFVHPNESGTHASTRAFHKFYSEVPINSISAVSKQSNYLDIQMMKMWGISRKYSWGYALRIASQLRDFDKS